MLPWTKDPIGYIENVMARVVKIVLQPYLDQTLRYKISIAEATLLGQWPLFLTDESY